MIDALPYVMVFTTALAVDYAWARYTAAATTHKRWLAGMWSVAIGFCGFITTINFVADHMVVFAMLAGYFVGTVLGIEPEEKS